MAGECTQTSSLGTTKYSSSIHNWWPDLHASSLSSSWSTTNNSWHTTELNNNSESSGEESHVSISTSFTNASNHSGLSVESSHDFIAETIPDNHIWSHVVLSDGSNKGLPSSQEFGEQLLDGLPPKNTSNDMFDPSSDHHYTKKVDNSWISSSSMESFNNIDKQFNALNHTLLETQRVPKLSNLFGNWSINPPQGGDINHHFEPRSDMINLNTMIKDPFSHLGLGNQSVDKNVHPIPYFGHDVQPMVLENTNLGDKSRYSYGLPNIPCTNSRSLTEVLSSVGHLSKPFLDTNVSKPILKTLDLSGFGKQVFQTSQFPNPKSTSSNLARHKRTHALLSSGGKKGKSEENLESIILKKPKQDATTVVSSTKMHVPKAKLAEKITALQQIVSPFGKTDTASVLWETIGCIRFLEEQIQLLSSPYTKGNASKDMWGGLDKKERGDGKLDLKSQGLCLVPLSCTPQIYHEKVGSDYLTPMYRGCLFR